MKRIQTACLHQTIHFQLKDNVPAEIAQRLVREEEKEYQENLNRRGVPYRIWNREVLPDGSIRIPEALVPYFGADSIRPEQG